MWVLEYQRACPQENHPDVAGLHLRLPPLILSFLLSWFPLIFRRSHLIYTLPLLPRFCLTFVLLSFDLSLFPLVLCFVPESLFTSSQSTSISASFCLCFRSLPPQPKRPPVLWDLISLQSKLQSLLGPEIQKQRVRDRESGIESVALQTHETTVASPLKRQAQWLGPEKLAGPLSTSLGAILNTNRRGLAVETKPWCHAAYFPWKAPGALGPTPGDMRSP